MMLGIDTPLFALSFCRSVSFWGTMLGLIAFVSSRIWFVSFVPTWWSDTTNSAVIAIGAIATLDKIISGKFSLHIHST